MQVHPSDVTIHNLLFTVQRNPGLFGILAHSNKPGIGAITKNDFLQFAKKLGFDGKALFDKLDTDQNGSLTDAEFESGFKELKNAIYDSLTKNADGTISKGGLKNFADALGLDLNKVFNRLDINSDGKVSEDEFDKRIGGILNHLGRFRIRPEDKTAGDNQTAADVMSWTKEDLKTDRVTFTGGKLIEDAKENILNQTSNPKVLDDEQADAAKDSDNIDNFQAFAEALMTELNPTNAAVMNKTAVSNFFLGLGLDPKDAMKILDSDGTGQITGEEFMKNLADVFQNAVPLANAPNSEDDPGTTLNFQLTLQGTKASADKYSASSEGIDGFISGGIDIFA